MSDAQISHYQVILVIRWEWLVKHSDKMDDDTISWLELMENDP